MYCKATPKSIFQFLQYRINGSLHSIPLHLTKNNNNTLNNQRRITPRHGGSLIVLPFITEICFTDCISKITALSILYFYSSLNISHFSIMNCGYCRYAINYHPTKWKQDFSNRNFNCIRTIEGTVTRLLH